MGENYVKNKGKIVKTHQKSGKKLIELDEKCKKFVESQGKPLKDNENWLKL